MGPSPAVHDPSVRIGFWPQSGQTPWTRTPPQRSWGGGLPEPLLVEYRPLRLGIVEHRAAAGEAGALVDRPGGGMAVAGFQHQPAEGLPAGQVFDCGENAGADAAAAMAGEGRR